MRIAVAGATGAVGREMLKILGERNFPADEVVLLASERSVGRKIPFRNSELTVSRLTRDSFDGADLALFSCGASRSIEFAPAAVKAGSVVVDNSSAFRMDEDVPLVVPEVNPEALKEHRGIIANPNCSTIQLVVALKPLHDAARVKRVVVSTYQAVSGAGQAAIDEMRAQIEGDSAAPRKMPHEIAFNCLPHIDVFLEGGYTKEEKKMVDETRKIMGAPKLALSATCVRVPVFNAHSESVNVEFEESVSPEEARALLSRAPGVDVVDDVESFSYPMPKDADGEDPVYVGRIRRDDSRENTLNLWVVADNLRKGAALNAVQIAEALIEKGMLRTAPVK
ncbi:MAG: aspartate-semialdehyde dehydrogenase [Nitrospinae bacterium]|nr:aspartate-semialdehyde dehydrogenase [Nitrospinota bacterium]